MTIFKCKMCGGNLDVSEGASFTVCPYCQTPQTVPTSHDEIVVNLFNKATDLRQKCEFDRAAETYDKILDLDYKQAEAHWGAVLCKYGIEYVDNSSYSGEPRKPTCHRTQLDSILADANYLATIQYAEPDAAELYKREADEINELQKKILNVVKNEKPFDVFICYKETGERNQRTQDSEIANEIYKELTTAGLRVFFAPVTLKTVGEYEPYIYAALYSSKVMVVLGTKLEYFTSVWVKNEWSRYLHMMKSDPTKKRGVIPCYRDMIPTSLPAELTPHQALDMSSVSFMPTLIRMIKAYIGKNQAGSEQTNTAVQDNTNTVVPLLKRASLFLEDGEFDRADEALERVLDLNPENAKAYIGKLMVEKKVRSSRELVRIPVFQTGKPLLREHPLFEKALRFADDEYKKVLNGFNEENLNIQYNYGKKLCDEREFVKACQIFNRISDYRDSAELVKKCDVFEKERIYTLANELMASGKYVAARKNFDSINGYKDVAELALRCSILEKERVFKDACLENEKTYNNANNEMAAGNYISAQRIFNSISGYKDAAELAERCSELQKAKLYKDACNAGRRKDYSMALSLFREIPGYRNANQLAAQCDMQISKSERKARRRNNHAAKRTVKGVFGTIGTFLGLGALGTLAGVVVGFIVALICYIVNLIAWNPDLDSLLHNYPLVVFAVVGAVVGLLIALIISILSWRTLVSEINK